MILQGPSEIGETRKKRNKERREEKKKAHHPSPKQGQTQDPDQKLEALLVFMLVCCARRRSVHFGLWSRVEEKNPVQVASTAVKR